MVVLLLLPPQLLMVVVLLLPHSCRTLLLPNALKPLSITARPIPTIAPPPLALPTLGIKSGTQSAVLAATCFT